MGLKGVDDIEKRTSVNNGAMSMLIPYRYIYLSIVSEKNPRREGAEEIHERPFLLRTIASSWRDVRLCPFRSGEEGI